VTHQRYCQFQYLGTPAGQHFFHTAYYSGFFIACVSYQHRSRENQCRTYV
jgi:hypothetical protein